MEFTPPTFNIAKLKRKMDISGLTLLIASENFHRRGRFYMLWRDGNFLIIQAEPWWRPGLIPDLTMDMCKFLEEHRALRHLQEVIQTMVDTIVFDGENNWAHLVRLKDKSYRLVYKKRRLIQNCDIWTKVVELADIEIIRFESGLCWEGTYNGKDVDIFIGWLDEWGIYVSAESRGQKLVQSRGVGHYFFDLEAHVSHNGVIVGIMKEPLVGRCVTQADRSAVFEAVADIQRHGIFFLFQIYDIYITERGVRFADASSAKYYEDRDALAERAQFMWSTLAEIFKHGDENPLRGMLTGSRSRGSNTFIIPRLPSPRHSVTLTPEDPIIRWVWSIGTSDEFCRFQNCAFIPLYALYHPSEEPLVRRDSRIKCDRRALLPPDDFPVDVELSIPRARTFDEPLAISLARYHPYPRRTSKRLILPEEFEVK